MDQAFFEREAAHLSAQDDARQERNELLEAIRPAFEAWKAGDDQRLLDAFDAAAETLTLHFPELK